MTPPGHPIEQGRDRKYVWAPSSPLGSLHPAGHVRLPRMRPPLALQCSGQDGRLVPADGLKIDICQRRTPGNACWGFRAAFLELSLKAGREGATEKHREHARQVGGGAWCEQRGKSGKPDTLPPLAHVPVLRSAYQRPVLAPLPDTDSECVVSQATG